MLKRLLPALAVVALLASSPAQAGPYSSLFIFGDSLSDSGNNTLVIGTDPLQAITGNTYIPTLTYASGQYTNGDVWAKTFASSLGLGAFGGPALAGGGNLAFGGARTSQEGALFGFPPSLKTQAGIFLGALPGGVAPSSALYVVAGGGNDARDTLTAAASDLPNAISIIGAAALQYATDTELIVHSLRNAGARSIVVWNTPNLGLVPAVRASGPGAPELGTLVAYSMNQALGAVMADETGVTIFDSFGLLTLAAANPVPFGLTNVTDACGNAGAGCDPLTSLFWDGIHPTSAGHALLAHMMLYSAAVVAVPEPETYAMMLLGLGLLGLVARRRRKQTS